MLKKILVLGAILYTLWLITISLITVKHVPILGFSFEDKIYHLIAYAILAFLWISYFKVTKRKSILKGLFIGLLAFGVILESIQHQINPNRTFDFYDLIANCLGVVFGTVIARKINIYKLN